MYGLLSILMEVKIREIQKTQSQSFYFASIPAFFCCFNFWSTCIFSLLFWCQTHPDKDGVAEALYQEQKNSFFPERIVFKLKLYGKLQQVQMHLSEKKTSFHCSYVSRCPTHRLLQKQSAATKSKYSALGPEATSINTQVWARNSFKSLRAESRNFVIKRSSS